MINGLPATGVIAPEIGSMIKAATAPVLPGTEAEANKYFPFGSMARAANPGEPSPLNGEPGTTWSEPLLCTWNAFTSYVPPEW